MSQENVAAIQGLYAAFARGDAGAALSLLDREIVWNEAESFPYADHNPYIGPEAVAQGVLFRLATEWDNFQVHAAEYVDGGDIVVTLGRYTGVYKTTGRALDAQFAHVWYIKNGKIARFQQYADTAQTAHAVQG
jgi:ketosteroid isomerase-like protein